MIKIEDIARVAHDTNVSYCHVLGEETQGLWDEAPEWQRQSTLNGVRFRLVNESTSVSAQHDQWLDSKYADGWVYGPVKDADVKQHPCLVPFKELPIEQQLKDYLFVAVVRALSAEGWQ